MQPGTENISSFCPFASHASSQLLKKASNPSTFAGYEGAAVVGFFAKYLACQDLNPSSVKVTDQTVNEFVDYFLAQDTGRCCQSDEGAVSALLPVDNIDKSTGVTVMRQHLISDRWQRKGTGREFS